MELIKANKKGIKSTQKVQISGFPPLLTEEEEESLEELSPPSQLIYSLSTSQLGDLMGLASQEDFFSSQEGVPALKRQRTLTTREANGIRMAVAKRPGNDDLGVDELLEIMERDRSTEDEEEALPLTFHTKEDLIRKLQGIQQLPRGEPCLADIF